MTRPNICCHRKTRFFCNVLFYPSGCLFSCYCIFSRVGLDYRMMKKNVSKSFRNYLRREKNESNSLTTNVKLLHFSGPKSKGNKFMLIKVGHEAVHHAGGITGRRQIKRLLLNVHILKHIPNVLYPDQKKSIKVFTAPMVAVFFF